MGHKNEYKQVPFALVNSITLSLRHSSSLIVIDVPPLQEQLQALFSLAQSQFWALPPQAHYVECVSQSRGIRKQVDGGRRAPSRHSPRCCASCWGNSCRSSSRMCPSRTYRCCQCKPYRCRHGCQPPYSKKRESGSTYVHEVGSAAISDMWFDSVGLSVGSEWYG